MVCLQVKLLRLQKLYVWFMNWLFHDKSCRLGFGFAKDLIICN